MSHLLGIFRRVNEVIWKDWLRGMQTSSERITAMSWSHSRSCGDAKQMLRQECPTLSSPQVIPNPFTRQGNTRWAALFCLLIFFFFFVPHHVRIINYRRTAMKTEDVKASNDHAKHAVAFVIKALFIWQSNCA